MALLNYLYLVVVTLGVFEEVSSTSRTQRVSQHRPLSQYELDLYELMRKEDTEPSTKTGERWTTDNSSERRAIHVLSPQFGNFGKKLYFDLTPIPTNAIITRAEVVFSASDSATEIGGITLQDSDVVLLGNSTTSGYKTDVSDALHVETTKGHSNFVVNVQFQQQARFRSHDRKDQRHQPLLVVFENIDTDTFFQKTNHARTRRANENRRDDLSSTPNESEECGLQPLTVHFGEIGLDDIILPTSYEAGICAGSCKKLQMNQTMYPTFYTYLNSLLGAATLHCVPVTFKPLTVTRIDKGGMVNIVQMENMKVSSCGCM